MKHNCLYCYKPLAEASVDFHVACCKKIFGSIAPPDLDLSQENLQTLARSIVARGIAVTGVQPKLSLNLEKTAARTSRLTVVGLWGNFILKPPTEEYESLPENEDLTMKLADLCGIKTAEHTLIRMKSGQLAYLTKRFDRINGTKIHVEDFCQLTESLTEHKYRGSVEKLGKIIEKFTTNRGLEALALFELVVFCFLTGNADMHLKNFSLVRLDDGNIALSPAYDLLSTKLALPQDTEESALTINGKKNNLKRTDFDELSNKLGINPLTTKRVYQKFTKKANDMKTLIANSFLSDNFKNQYIVLLDSRLLRLDL